MKNAALEPLRQLQELIDRKGAREASRLLGLSENSCSDMVRKGKCRPAYNLAAQHLISLEDRRAEATYLYFVRVPRDRKEILETFLNGMSLKFRVFAE